MPDSLTQIVEHLLKLESIRQNPAVVYCGTLEKPALAVLYECLCELEPGNGLDFLLLTKGGQVNAARRMALLLHEYTQQLSVLIPYHARSAGTLLCLGAHQLIMGPLAELSPIDGHIGLMGEAPADLPPVVSAENVRAFRKIAEEWFDVTKEEERLQVFALLSQRIFPTSLGAFYRSDQLIRRLADEMLTFQLPLAEATTRRQIIEQLISLYPDHSYAITRTEAKRLGLQVTVATTAEEKQMWQIYKLCDAYTNGAVADDNAQVTGLIVAKNFRARRIRKMNIFPGKPTSDHPSEHIIQERWEII